MKRLVVLFALAVFCLSAKPCSVDSPCFERGYEDGWAFATMAAYEHAVWICQYETKKPTPECTAALSVHKYLDDELRDMRRWR